jgi:peptide/nickel transport system permease protein
MTVAAISRVGWRRGRSYAARLAEDHSLVIGLFLVAGVAVLAAAASWIAPYSPTHIDVSEILAAPSRQHLLGTDELGRDLLSRLMFGAQVSLGVASMSVALAAVAGTALGGMAGLRRGWAEMAVLRATDVVLGFPTILVAIVLMAILGVSLTNMVIALAVGYTPQFVRISWGSVLVLREQSFVQSAKLSGKSLAVIVLRHLVPNMVPELLVQTTLSFGGAILAESSLSYLGLGVQPPLADWGSMVSTGQEYISASMYYMLFPGLAIALTVLGFNLVGDGLTRLLDPRRGRIAI